MVWDGLGLPYIVLNLVKSMFLSQNGNLILGISNMSPWWVRNAWSAHDRNVFTNLHQHPKAAPFHATLQNRNSGWEREVMPLFLDSNSCSVNNVESGYRKLSARWPCKIMVWMALFSALCFAELALRQLLFLYHRWSSQNYFGEKDLKNIKYFSYRGNETILWGFRVIKIHLWRVMWCINKRNCPHLKEQRAVGLGQHWDSLCALWLKCDQFHIRTFSIIPNSWIWEKH